MEIVWEDPPPPEGPFFTRDLYDKHSLAPNVRELWNFLQSSEEISTDQEKTERPGQDDSFTEEHSWKDSHSETEEPNSKSTKEESKKHVGGQIPFPEPRVPYPCFSALTKAEQKKYLDFLTSYMKKKKPPPQALLTRVNNEVMQFMMYLQDVSRMCSEDYSVISQGALQYSEEFFRSSLEHIKTLPQLYKIHELTSLTGGRFNPALTLTFEKQLLIMGSVDITDYKPAPVDAQLASDYQSVSSQTPPAKKAKDVHASISGDSNAEKLSNNYEPHVCLTREALVQLLNNHGPDFREQWEIPVLIKTNHTKGKKKKKTVFIDSPLLKPEATVRERSHIYHEESLKLCITKNGRKNVFHVMTERPVCKQPVLERDVVSFENDSLDFEGDLSDLETFGENTPNKVKRTKKELGSGEKVISEIKKDCNMSDRSLEEEMEPTQSGSKDTDMVEVETAVALKETSDQDSDGCAQLSMDSDNEKLIIDDTVPKISPPAATPEFSSPVRATRSKLQLKSRKEDQLGQILRMQTAMFSGSVCDSAKATVSQDPSSPPTQPRPSHPTSLVKACVSSYLERNPNQEEETGEALHTTAAAGMNGRATESKRLLSQDLQAAAEDEQDYECPEEGNLLYKLYSLDDLLLLVRSSISFAHPKRVDEHQNTCVPVNVFPKLEYQLTYGIERLSSSEACQLWTETLLHSSTVSYIAHINALTSRVALLRKLPDDWIQSGSCGLTPSKSLNILHHLLKKLTGLAEGHYLLGHKVGEPFVNILKAANGNGRQGVYNLQQIHSDVPPPPASASVPWVPLDPSVYLPFHRKHGRVPCTFPPQEFTQTFKAGTSQPCSRGGPPGSRKPAKMKTKKKHAAKSRK